MADPGAKRHNPSYRPRMVAITSDVPRDLWRGRAVAFTVAAGPLLAVACLTLFAWRGSLLVGHWPVPWVDDPKDLANADPLSAVFYAASMVLVLFAVCTLALFPVSAAFALRREYFAGGSSRWVVKAVVLTLIWLGGWVALDGSEGVKWLMD